MTGETVCELLTPLIGKSGTIFMVVGKAGQIGIAMTENNKLTGVQIRSDGLVALERPTGWTVIDPSEVVVMGWTNDVEHTTGQFL